jgi:hypothetical protein
MSEWQPIETAPKDGTIILLADDHTVAAGFYWAGNKRQYTGFQDLIDDPKFCWLVLDSDVNREPLNAYKSGGFNGITHWMPLPSPPND